MASRLRSVLPLAALALLGGGAAAARAAPVAVQVRIEGRSETLFEGPVMTEGGQLKAASETAAHPCDGLNDKANPTPGPTPTAAAAEAMASIGESFDARWYPGYEDFLVTRWGPEKEAGGESWGLYANDAHTSVGGCQYELHEGAQVLWSYAKPTAEPLLALLPAGASTAGTPPLAVTAELNTPCPLEVLAYKLADTAHPSPRPERTGASAYPGAELASVQTATDGFQKPLPESSPAVKTDAEGRASITFTTSGWHRIKALAPGAIRSNRLDVCVPAAGAQSCGPPPAGDETPSPAGQLCAQPPGEATPEPSSHTGPEPGGSSGGGEQPSGPAPRERNELRLDGLTLDPLGTRSPALHLHGPWDRLAEAGAWQGSVLVGRAGATLSLTLARGRPAFILRDIRAGALVEVRSGGHGRRYRLARSIGYRLLLGISRSRPGPVSLRVLAGAIGLDGVTATP